MTYILRHKMKEIDGIISKGSYDLKSGSKSDFYVNIKKTYGHPEILKLLTDIIWTNNMNKETTCIVGQGHGGIPLAAAIASMYSLNLTLIKEDLKKHGMRNLIDGHIPITGDKVSIVDDVFTTGKSLRRIIKIVNKTGAKILGCHVVLKRGEGVLDVPLTYLLVPEDLL